MRPRLLFPLLFVTLLALLAACASGPRSIEIPKERLEAALAHRFPYQARPAGLFAVTVGVPQLRLQPQDNRLRLDAPVEASNRVLRRAVHGNLAVSFGVRYEPADTTVRAVDVRVEDFSIQGAPSELRGPLQAMGAAIAESLLEGTVLHAFRPDDLARANGWTPHNLRVTRTGLVVELQPPVARAGAAM
jgi:hypothetical protein